MTLSRLSLVTLCFIFLPFISAAQNNTDGTEVRNKIFEAIAVEGILMETPRNLHSQFSQNPFGLPPSKNNKMMKLFLEAFSSKQMVPDFKEYFKKNHDQQKARLVVNWMNAEHSQPILKAQKEYYTLQGIRKRLVNKYEIEQNSPTEKRSRLIDSLAATMSIAESTAEARAIVFRALVSAFDEISSQRSFSKTQINGIVSNFRNQARSQINRELIDQLLVKYHDLDNKTIRHYISFQKSEAGKWLRNTTSKAVHTAYRKASNRFIESIRKQ